MLAGNTAAPRNERRMRVLTRKIVATRRPPYNDMLVAPLRSYSSTFSNGRSSHVLSVRTPRKHPESRARQLGTLHTAIGQLSATFKGDRLFGSAPGSWRLLASGRYAQLQRCVDLSSSNVGLLKELTTAPRRNA